MAWIHVIPEAMVATNPEHARLRRLYTSGRDPEHGAVDNILTIHSLRPATLDGHLRLYASVMHPRHEDGLSRRERELLAVVVSAANSCHY